MSKQLKFALKLLLGLLIMAWVYRSTTVDTALIELSELRLSFVGIFFLIAITNSYLSALKWWWVLRVDGVSVRLRELFVSYMIGSFLNLFLPSNIGGDGYRIASLGKGRMLKSTASVVADRLSGLFALTALGAVFSLVAHGRFTHPLVSILPVAMFAMVVMVIIALFFPTPSRLLLKWVHLDRFAPIRTLANALFESFNAYRRNPSLLLGLLVISFAFQFFYIEAIYVLARTLRIDEIPLVTYCIFVPVISIIESIPISFYGLGLRDAGYLAFFTEVGLPEPGPNALSLSMLYVGATVLFVMTGGVLLLIRLSRSKEAVNNELVK
jgi:uncharacterized membrane protein YbhN (UPF0104 family)